MAATITKTVDGKAKTVTESQQVPAELVDEIGQLHAQVALAEEKLKPHRDKLRALMDEARSIVDETTEPDDEITIYGEEHAIDYGKRGKRATVTDTKQAAIALEQTEKGLALELATFSVTALRKYLTPEQLEDILTDEYAIKRRETVRELA